jgi:hypothetical protein
MRQWQASPRAAERVAARIATELAGKDRWHPVDGSPVIAARLDVSTGTVRRAEVLLTDNGVIMKSADSFFYVA